MTDSEYDFGPLEALAAPPAPGDARALVEAARIEAMQVHESAREEGLALGRQEARDAVAPAIAALEEIARETHHRGNQLADRFEADAVELAFALAEQVLGAHVEADRGLVLNAVRGALRGLVEREHVTVLVHPDDLDVVRDAGDELRSTLGGIERWEVQSERRVSRGGAIVRYRDGQIDASHVAKLERAREVVQESLAPPVVA